VVVAAVPPAVLVLLLLDPAAALSLRLLLFAVCAGVGMLLVGGAAGGDDALLKPFFDDFSSVAPSSSGLTLTLTGVGCVLKTGIWQSCNVRVSGINNPLPMQINRTFSPPEQDGRSNHDKTTEV
jgi:hypothetical protein